MLWSTFSDACSIISILPNTGLKLNKDLFFIMNIDMHIRRTLVFVLYLQQRELTQIPPWHILNIGKDL